MGSVFRIIQKIYKPLTVILLFALIVIVIKRTGKKDPQEETTFNTGNTTGQAVTVEADSCFTGELVLRVTATGLVKAAREAEITPQASGVVTALPYGEGDVLKKGAVILQLDDREARLAWLTAHDQLSKAEDSFVEQLMSSGNARAEAADGKPLYLTRMEALLTEAQTNGHSDEQVDAVQLWKTSAEHFASESLEARWASRTGLTAAKLALDKAQYRLEQCSIHAPFDGVLGNQDVCTGRQVGPGKAVFTLVDLSSVRIAAQCLENEVGHIRLNSTADVALAAFPDETFKGRVVAVNPIVDEKTRTCRVTVNVDNADGRIKAGMYAEVRLESARYAHKLLVPRKAVLERDNRTLVFIAREGKAKWCYVDLGLSNDHYYEVTGSAFGLKAGESVLTDGHYTLAHDAPIKIKRPQ